MSQPLGNTESGQSVALGVFGSYETAEEVDYPDNDLEHYI